LRIRRCIAERGERGERERRIRNKRKPSERESSKGNDSLPQIEASHGGKGQGGCLQCDDSPNEKLAIVWFGLKRFIPIRIRSPWCDGLVCYSCFCFFFFELDFFSLLFFPFSFLFFFIPLLPWSFFFPFLQMVSFVALLYGQTEKVLALAPGVPVSEINELIKVPNSFALLVVFVVVSDSLSLSLCFLLPFADNVPDQARCCWSSNSLCCLSSLLTLS
jgi:hypothetical protein